MQVLKNLAVLKSDLVVSFGSIGSKALKRSNWSWGSLAFGMAFWKNKKLIIQIEDLSEKIMQHWRYVSSLKN